jgi:HAE1 family hydrophobic/amphiphilic exporter-1/multidrug efflux pump
LNEVTQAFLQRVSTDPQLGFAQTLWRANVPQLYVSVDREKAKKVGVPITDVFNALSATLGNYYVNDFNKFGRAWQVLMSADPSYRNRPTTSARSTCARTAATWCRSTRCERAVQLRPRLARPLQQPAGGEDLRRRRARASARARHRARRADREGSAAAGLQLRLGRHVLPGEAQSGASTFALGLAVVMVFLILAAQYEKWSLPFSVLLALPFGTFGAPGRDPLARAHQRRVLPDRPRDAARASPPRTRS